MKLIVFDIDGTLTDTIAVYDRCFLRSVHRFGIDEVDSNWGTYEHHSDSWIFAEIVRRALGRDPTAEERRSFSDELTRTFFELVEEDPVREIPGAASLLQRLGADGGVALAFATGAFRTPSEHKLGALEVNPADHVLVTSSEFETREEIVTTAIDEAREKYAVERFSSIVSVGDGHWDLRTAQRLELDFVGVGTGPRAAELEREGAPMVVPDLTSCPWLE